MKIISAIAVLAGTIAFPQLAAAEDDYLDNRSDVAVLVRSLYNAINRKEYARAWDYFGDQKPAASYAKFTDGYADTTHVEVATGAIGEEGAAGSIFYSVPVAIRATGKDGESKTFAGCYTARLAQPQIQEPPFRPMQVEKGALKPVSADGSLADALPETCGDAPPNGDATRDKIVIAFKAAYGDSCQTLMPDAEPGAADPELQVLKFRYKYETDSDPEHEAKLYKFDCGMGAYNSNEIYYLAGDDGAFRQLQFATPDLDIRYDDPDGQTKLKSMTVIGYTAADQLVNSEFDENDRSLTSFSKWRGIGDASSVGRWIFRDGDFTLVHYEVDPTTDGEVNPETVLDFETAP